MKINYIKIFFALLTLSLLLTGVSAEKTWNFNNYTVNISNDLYVSGKIYGDASGLSGLASGGQWNASNGYLYPANLSNKVGIGLTNPTSEFEVYSTRTTGYDPFFLIKAGKNSGQAASVAFQRALNTQQMLFAFETGSSSNPDGYFGTFGGKEDALYMLTGTGSGGTAALGMDSTLGLRIGTASNVVSGAVGASISPTGQGYFAGNVGVGTTTPQNKLNVIGDGNFTGAIYGGNIYSNGALVRTTGIDGSGTTNYIPKWNTGTTLSNSIISQSGTDIGINRAVPTAMLDVFGDIKAVNLINITGIYGSAGGKLNFQDPTTGAEYAIRQEAGSLTFDIAGTANVFKIYNNYASVNGYPVLTTASTIPTATTSTYVSSSDGTRDASDKLPTTSPKSVRFDFSSASSAGTSGTYAGVMTYAPWVGTTASTGDASYQLAFGSTAANGGGVPILNIRKGIDSTWNSWYKIWHSGNDGAGSGLDADLLDGLSSSQFLPYKSRLNSADSTSADTFSGGQTFDYNTAGSGINGPLISFGGLGHGYDMQIAGAYTGGTAIKFRTRNGDTASWNSWNTIWNSGNDGSGSGLDADTCSLGGTCTVNQIAFSQGPNYKIYTNANGLVFDGGDGTADFLVYDERIYLDNLVMGYQGTSDLTTYDTNEALNINPNGAGDVNIKGGNVVITIGDTS